MTAMYLLTGVMLIHRPDPSRWCALRAAYVGERILTTCLAELAYGPVNVQVVRPGERLPSNMCPQCKRHVEISMGGACAPVDANQWEAGARDALAIVRARLNTMPGLTNAAYKAGLSEVETMIEAMLLRGSAKSTTELVGRTKTRDLRRPTVGERFIAAARAALSVEDQRALCAWAKEDAATEEEWSEGGIPEVVLRDMTSRGVMNG